MIKNILKGAVIGLANIIPGVSGGTMAVSMGIYDKLIHCVTHIFSEFKKSVAFLMPIIIGAGLALVGLSFVIDSAFSHFPMQTNFFIYRSDPGRAADGHPGSKGKFR
jgi:putative membrane protein